MNIKCVFQYSLQLLSKTLLNLRRIQVDTDILVNVHTSSYKVGRLRVRFPMVSFELSDCNKKLVFSQQIFKKYSNIRFHENLSSGSRVVSCGRTDGRTEWKIWRSQQSLYAIYQTQWNGHDCSILVSHSRFGVVSFTIEKWRMKTASKFLQTGSTQLTNCISQNTVILKMINYGQGHE